MIPSFDKSSGPGGPGPTGTIITTNTPETTSASMSTGETTGNVNNAFCTKYEYHTSNFLFADIKY